MPDEQHPPRRRRDWGDEPEKDRRDDSPDDFEDEFDDDRPRRRERADYEREHRAGLILTLGIVSITISTFCPFLPLPLSVVAWMMANNDLRAMDAGEMNPKGRSNTHGGKICAIVGFCLGLFYAVLMLLYFTFAVGLFLFRK